jgi:hypothetical protein
MPIINQPANPTQPTSQVNPQEQNDPVGKRDIGSGFTNIRNILNANQGAGAQIGNNIANSVSNQAGRLQGSVDANQADFTNQAQQNFNTNQGNITNANNAVNTTNSDDTYYTNIGKALSTSQYTGPQGLTNAQNLQNQASNLNNVGGLLNTTNGQGSLIRSYAATPGNYTRGQQALDSMFLGQDKGAQQNLKSQQKNVFNIAQNVQNANALDQQTANTYKTAIDNNKANTLTDFTNKANTIDQSALTQGTDYNSNISRLKQLMSGVDANGQAVHYNTLTDADQQLLQNLNKYGINNENIYLGRDDARNNVLDSIAGTATIAQGGKQYTDEQKNQAKNLALLMQNTDLANTIRNNQFNSTFTGGKDSTLYNPATQAHDTDVSDQQKVQNYINFVNQHDLSSLYDNRPENRQIDLGMLGAALNQQVGDTGFNLGHALNTRDYGSSMQNKIIDFFTNNTLTQEQQNQVHQFQNSPGRTTGQVMDLIKGLYSGRYSDLNSRIPKYGSIQEAILQRLGKSPDQQYASNALSSAETGPLNTINNNNISPR